jgi:hypothetical protein
MKIVVTFKLEKKELDFDPSKGFGALNLVYSVLAGALTISDSPLKFNELILTHIFSSQSNLTNLLKKHYTTQGAMQFYKILGSSDMIGNPVGFIEKLGEGVIEFVNEPRKGLIKGPKEFAGGIGKGVTSLVSGVVSAGFGSVSKITGSLYSIAKSATGEKDVET